MFVSNHFSIESLDLDPSDAFFYFIAFKILMILFLVTYLIECDQIYPFIDKTRFPYLQVYV